ncbi:MAG: porin [Burkholderiales bacterium]
MKKSLVALAVLAASGAAMAQSSVTLFGIVDAGYAVGNGSISDKTSLRNSGYNSSRLGFRGVEDLGGGMKAGFHLEAGVNNDDGTGAASSAVNQAQTAANVGTQGLTFNRRSVVTLSGKMGELILGRDYTPQFWSETVYDPFGTNGVGTNIAFNKGGTTGVRSSNGIGYKSPSMGGVALWAQTWNGENASTAAKTGSGNGFRITFDQGKFSAAVADSSLTTGAGTTNKTSNMAASYDLGVAKVMAMSNKTKITGAADIKGSVIGALVPMAGGTFRIASSQTEQAGKESKLMAVGFIQPMSKRTDLYATYARVSNAGGAAAALNGAVTAANGSSTGYEFGIKHAF